MTAGSRWRHEPQSAQRLHGEPSRSRDNGSSGDPRHSPRSWRETALSAPASRTSSTGRPPSSSLSPFLGSFSLEDASGSALNLSQPDTESCARDCRRFERETLRELVEQRAVSRGDAQVEGLRELVCHEAQCISSRDTSNLGATAESFGTTVRARPKPGDGAAGGQARRSTGGKDSSHARGGASERTAARSRRGPRKRETSPRPRMFTTTPPLRTPRTTRLSAERDGGSVAVRAATGSLSQPPA